METETKSDNQKETKRKRKTEDHKSKKKKKMEKTEIDLSGNISKVPCVKQARMENIHLVDINERPEMLTEEDSKFGSAINSVTGKVLHFIETV